MGAGVPAAGGSSGVMSRSPKIGGVATIANTDGRCATPRSAAVPVPRPVLAGPSCTESTTTPVAPSKSRPQPLVSMREWRSIGLAAGPAGPSAPVPEDHGRTQAAPRPVPAHLPRLPQGRPREQDGRTPDSHDDPAVR